MKYEVYKITNKINGKLYIGQTKIGYLNRFKKHIRDVKHYNKTALQNAIIKYGKENFTCELLDSSAVSQADLNKLEQKYIKDLNTICPNGYNIKSGGEEGIVLHKLRFRKNEALQAILVFIDEEINIKPKFLSRVRSLQLDIMI